VYPPEYIELRLTEQGEVLRGSYRARYLVSDQPISPVVTFRFEGKASEEEWEWQGAGGARGRVKLRLKSRGTLELQWFATEMGTQLSLGSGNATLLRRKEP
jgi:hypothetical protein